MNGSSRRAILLWDGECGLCRKCVEWVEKRDTGGKIQPIPYQEIPSPPMTDFLRRRCGNAIQLIHPGKEPVSSAMAALGVLSLLGWKRTAAVLSAVPLRWAAEAGYFLIARNRALLGRLFIGK